MKNGWREAMVHTMLTGEGRSDQGEESSCLNENPEEVLGYETCRPAAIFFGPPLRMNIIINEHAN
jgi:hypothetical protein